MKLNKIIKINLSKIKKTIKVSQTMKFRLNEKYKLQKK